MTDTMQAVPHNTFLKLDISVFRSYRSFERSERVLLVFEGWRNSDASLSPISLSSRCLYLLGARRLRGALGGPPFARSPPASTNQARLPWPGRPCSHLHFCRFSGQQGSSHGSDLYSPAQGHSAQIRGKSNLKDPIREHFIATPHSSEKCT